MQATLSLKEKIEELREKIPEARINALDELLHVGLPARKHEEYKYTPLTRFYEEISGKAGKTEIRPDRYTDPEFILKADTHKLYIINGMFDAETADIPKGITVKTNDTPGLKNPKEHDAFDLLNDVLFTSGCNIMVPANFTVEKPLVIINVIDKASSVSESHISNRIHMGQNAELTIIEVQHYIGENESFDSSVSNYHLEKDARLNSYTVQVDGNNNYHYNSHHVHQESGSVYNNFTMTLSGKMLRNNHNVTLDDSHCETNLLGFYFADDQQHIDNHTTVDHRKPDSNSNELYKGILKGTGKGVFNGKIYVRPHAQNTLAYQSNKNILLSDEATVHTKPQLEIWADDVKCSHGCTAGQLDNEALFYLRSRGLSEDYAKAYLLNAFASEITDEIKPAFLKDYLSDLIHHKLSSNDR